MTTVDKIEAFELRTKGLSLRVIKLFQSLPKTDEARIIGKQLLRSATSVAANYRVPAGHDLIGSFAVKFQLWLRKLMKLCSGSNYC